MDGKVDYKKLYERYLDRGLTFEEETMLFLYFHRLDTETELDKAIDKAFAVVPPESWENQVHIQKTFQQVGANLRKIIYQHQGETTRHRVLNRFRYLAAMVVFALTIGLFIWYNGRDTTVSAENSIANVIEPDILPGGSRAVLTLPDGRMVDLSEAHTGIIVDGGITYLDGTVVDTPTTAGGHNETDHVKLPVTEVPMLVLSTPRGGTYQIMLPDGSKVWLNAESTLRYPSQFVGNDRVVELEGEGYFEVSKDTERPFKVRSAGQMVEVLGTAFNVAAYPDSRQFEATLVTGRVTVGNEKGGEKHRLRPGQQAAMAGDEWVVKKVDVNEFIDWKDGYFTFSETPLKIAMTKIGRWYDVKFDYQGQFDDMHFGGSVSRKNSLRETLDILASTSAMQFNIKGRRVLVMRK